jgi:hypothetical protein
MQAAGAEAAFLEGSTRAVASPTSTEGLNAEAYDCPGLKEPPKGQPQPCVVANL